MMTIVTILTRAVLLHCFGDIGCIIAWMEIIVKVIYDCNYVDKKISCLGHCQLLEVTTKTLL